MLAYNGSVPGPTLRVRRARRSSSTSRTTATSRRPCTGTGCASTTATTGRTRRRRRSRSAGASPTGSSSRIPGVYWYHPHIREDYGQELGLYGNIVVDPADPDYWPPAHREVAAHARRHPDRGRRRSRRSAAPRRRYAAMGRFGNVMLVNGETDLALDARARRGRALLPHQHRQHARVQRRRRRARG